MYEDCKETAWAGSVPVHDLLDRRPKTNEKFFVYIDETHYLQGFTFIILNRS